MLEVRRRSHAWRGGAGVSRKHGKAKRDHEWYPTPGWVTERLLERLRLPKRRALSLLEPCSGDGAIVDVVDARRSCRDIWTTIDIRPEARGSRAGTHYTGDAREVLERLCDLDLGARWDLGVTNPPFTLADDFVRAMVPRCERTAMLLGLDWYSGPRRAVLERFPCSRVIVIPERISFDGKGSDQRTHAWFVFEREDSLKGATPVATVLEMAAPTDPLVIAQWKETARARIYQHDLEQAGQFRLCN